MYVRQLMRTNLADQAAFDAFHKKHGTRWLVELTASVHYYAMLCGVVNAFEVAARRTETSCWLSASMME